MTTAQKLQRTGIKTALLTLLIGSIIFFAYYQTLNDKIIYLEYLFIFAAAAINLIVLMRLFTYSQKHKRGKTGLRIVSGGLLITLLIMLALFRYMSTLSDTLQIKLVNNSQSQLTNIKLSGCQRIRLDNLYPGEDKTVWIHIERDCAIEVAYNQNGAAKNEVISAYVTTAMGRKMTYELGTN